MDLITLQVETSAGLVTYAQLRVEVQAVNDAPVLQVPGAILSVFDLTDDQQSYQLLGVETFQCVEDSSCTLTDLAARDVDLDEVDNGVLEVQVSAQNGTFKDRKRRVKGKRGAE